MPNALKLAGTQIIGSDPSRAPLADGMPGLGWVWATPEQVAQAAVTLRPQWIDDEVVSGPVLPDPPKVYSKLKIRRKLRLVGLESGLNALLASTPDAADDWADAQFLAETDPFLVSSVPLFAVATGKTEAEVWALLATCQD